MPILSLSNLKKIECHKWFSLLPLSISYQLYILGSQTEILSFFIENNTQNRKLISVRFATKVFINSLASAAINDLIPVKDPFNANIAKNLSVSLPLLKVIRQNVIQNMKTPLHLLRLVAANRMCSYFNNDVCCEKLILLLLLTSKWLTYCLISTFRFFF